MGVLNFRTDRLITGVNVIDGNLYWTDDNSEPKKLEIDRFRDYNHENGQTTILSDNVIESDLTVIRLHPWRALEMELTEYTPTANAPEPPFESIFPRFSYRWKYEDGQFSPYAPFTQAAFMPASRTEGTTNEENYTEGFNTTMFNNVGTIVLNNIPRGPRDVVSVQLLYTESISTTIYILEELEIPPAQRGYDYVIDQNRYTGGIPVEPIYDPMTGDLTNGSSVSYSLLPLRYQLSARKIFRALPARELSRPYDSVPQIAKAQEITANRLIYGNYRFGPSAVPGQPDSYYQQPTVVAMDTEIIDQTDSDGVTLTGDGLHVKGNRTYELGVAYIDAYGRQGPMIQIGSITSDLGVVDEQIPITTNFHQANRQQLQATMRSEAPAWADRYRYFVKDVSMDHHNLISYNIYNDGDAAANDSEFVWIEFQSTDRNKVVDERSAGDGNTATILTLRRENDTVQTTKQRFLVQEIENEAPDDVRRALTQTASNNTTTSHGTIDRGPYDTNRDFPTTAGSSFLYWESAASVSIFQVALDLFNRVINRNQGSIPQPSLNTTHRFSGNDGVANGVEVDMSELESPVYLKFSYSGTDLGQSGLLVQVDGLVGYNEPGSADNLDRLRIALGQHWLLDDDGQITIVDGGSGIPTGYRSNQDPTVEIFTSSISEEAAERLQGRFWVRTARNGLATQQSTFTFDGELQELQQFWFETEPAVQESQLDLFWETSDTFCVCTEHGYPNKINWFNCVAEVLPESAPMAGDGGVYLESTRINDKFNTVQLVKGVKANIPTERSSLEERPYGLIWSGIYNSRTSANRFNEFIEAEGIVKELEPNYGTIQKLHTRDTNIIAFTEDKCFRILADKDQLFNADGGGNVSASNAVLGQTTPFVGEYGISTNPESFASYGHNIYFTDRNRGVVCQLTPGNGQIFELSSRGMNDFFRDRLRTTDKAVGMFDDYTDKYVLSIQGYDPMDAAIDEDDAITGEDGNTTIGYELDVEGWPSRFSYIPEMGLTLNNRFYTWKNGQLWRHNSDTTPRNNFYGTQYDSHVQVIFNDNPSAIKEFLTLGYEGTEGWEVTQIDTESEDTALTSTWPFVRKENKYFTPIVSTENIYGFEDAGMGSVIADDGMTEVYITGTKDKSGIKGFYNVITLTNDSTAKAELFAVNSENFISSN